MAAQRTYILPIASLASLTTVPFAQLAPPAGSGIEIIAIELGQEASTTSAQTVLTAQRRSTASTLPTATTPYPAAEKDPASALTGSTTTNATGIATVTGTAQANSPWRWCFNVLNGLLWLPTPDMRITVAASSFLTFQFQATPPAVTWSGQVWFRELI